jgi:alanine racemase
LALRAHAARIGLQVMLAQRQLGARAHVESDEVPSGIMVRFIVADAAAAAAVRERMQTFALSSASFEANRAELTATPVSLLRNRGAWHPP